MQLDPPQPDTSRRLRLVDVRVDESRGTLRLGPHLSGVLAEPADRSTAARRIATTVAGPRDDGAGGTVEVDGEIRSVWTLPAEILPRAAPIVVDLAIVHAQWRAAWGRRRDELAAAHASCRLEGYRIDAALERAADRLPLPGAPVRSAAPRVAHAPAPVPAPAVVARESEPDPPRLPNAEAPPVDWASPPDGSTRTRAQLHVLLDRLDAVRPEPLPEGALLADAWDAHSALLQARAATDALPAAPLGAHIDSLEQRVNAARAAVEASSRRVPDEARVNVEQRHRAVVESEAAVFEAKRRKRADAQSRYDAAVADERVALAQAGFDSYASYLFEITAGSASTDLAARLAAETELTQARAALDAARQVPSVPTRAELAAREVQMRTRSAELLGHDPGADPAAELRALTVERADRAATIAEIAEVLGHGGVPVAADPLQSARAYLASGAPAPVPAPAPAAAPESREVPRVSEAASRAAFEAAEAWVEPPVGAERPAAARPATPHPATPHRAAPRPPAPRPGPSAAPTVDPAHWREVADLEEQRAAQRRTLAQYEAALTRIDEITSIAPDRLGGADLARAFEAVLGAYDARELLGGRLPMVLDGVLDGLTRDVREAALHVFARAADVQTVVVTADPEVMQSLSREGGTLVRWPEPMLDLVAEAARDAARTRRA